MANDRDRFLRLFLPEQDRLYAFIRIMVRDRALADDILQEVSVILWEKLGRFEEGTSFGAWARGIALNKIRSERRRIAKAPVLLAGDACDAVMSAFDRMDGESDSESWREALHRCLEHLSPSVRRVVKLRYFEGWRLQDVGKELRRSVSGVNNTLRKARLFLEQCVRRTLRDEAEI